MEYDAVGRNETTFYLHIYLGTYFNIFYRILQNLSYKSKGILRHIDYNYLMFTMYNSI